MGNRGECYAVSTIAVTGADGFVGTNVSVALEKRGHPVRRIVRSDHGPGSDRKVVPDLSSSDSLDHVLDGVETLVHLAARAHVLRETEPHPEAAFQRANVDATVRLAEAAIRAGVRRFVFVSSIHVNGNQTRGVPFTESDEPAPIEPYARSKLAAERSLRSVAGTSDLEVVIVRPTLVYGPGVRGNFLRLLSLVDSGIPLPFASLRNRRSLIGVENLTELLALCAERPAAAGELFLAAEAEVHSTPGLIRAIAHAMRRPSRLFGVPEKALGLAARSVGVQCQFDKICGSLEVRSNKAQDLLGWAPGVSFREGIAATVTWYRERGNVTA
jgi:nucleoside-diphosphate-sugar epimerase